MAQMAFAEHHDMIEALPAAVRHEEMTFYDAARDNRPVAVDIAIRHPNC